MAPVMLCKTSKRGKHGETRGKSIEIKSKFACILEASESVRLRMEESLLNHHEDHIAGKGDGEQHTSHVTFSRWYTFNDTHMRGSSRKFGVRTSHLMRHLHALMLCVWFFSTSPLFSLCCLSSLLSSSPSSWPETCVGQIPCAHQLMRTLAPLPSTTLSQVMRPTTTTYWTVHPGILRRERVPEWLLSTMTTPSAWRSLHHCSPRSEKMMRAVDEVNHSHDEGLSSSQSSSVGHRTGRPVVEQFDSQIPHVRENPRFSLIVE